MTKTTSRSGARKSAFLGMPHGTATNRLRKLILFDLLERHEENVCFRCSRKIERADELTVEHKRPWEGVSVELFWSLENIAFSHRYCNTPHRYAGGQARKRKVGPEGTAWCRRCKDFLPVAAFSRNRTRWNGLQAWCDGCAGGWRK
jgi:HNH endonuclease